LRPGWNRLPLLAKLGRWLYDHAHVAAISAVGAQLIMRERILAATSAICAGVLAAALALHLQPTSAIPWDAVFLSLAVTGFIAFIAVRRYLSTRDLLDPLVLFSAALVYYFGLHTLWMTNPAHLVQLKQQFFHPFVSGIVPSIALLGLGYVLLVAGFALVHTPEHTRAVSREYAPRVLAIVFVIGMGGYVAAASAGAYAKGQNSATAVHNLLTFATIGFFAVVALIVCTCQHYRTGQRRSKYWRLMWVMLIVQLAFSFGAGEKRVAFIAFFAWLAALNYSRSLLQPKLVTAVAAVALFVVTPVIQSTRPLGIVTQASLSGVASTESTIPSRVLGYFTNFPDEALSGFDILNNRTFGAESLATAYLYTPTLAAYRHGAEWGHAITDVIPRFLLPNKTQFNPSLVFSEMYAGESASAGFGLTISPTLPGDFYMNFGWPGILAGMFVVGLILGWLRTVRGRFLNAGVTIYVAGMIAIVLVEQPVNSIGTAMLSQFIATGGAFLVLRVLAFLSPAASPSAHRRRGLEFQDPPRHAPGLPPYHP
jgi:oligosaccharide repeat unit polymerase